MKPHPKKNPESALTLIEYVGVLAAIALITGMLAPRVLAAVENARLSQTVSNLKTVRTAALGYFGEYGRFGGIGGVKLEKTATNWTEVLIAEHLLDTPFSSRLSDSARIEVVSVPQGAVPGSGGCFDLSGTGDTAIPAGSQVVVARLTSVSADDAWALSKRFDGTALSAPDRSAADTQGRVTYPAGGGTVTVYLVHLPAGTVSAVAVVPGAEATPISSPPATASE